MLNLDKEDDTSSDDKAPPTNDEQIVHSSLFSRLIERIKSTFSPSKTSQPTPLQGRIHGNPGKQADKVLARFLIVAKNLEKTLDSELVSHVQSAMELITRDFRRIQKKVHSSGEEGEQVYYQWMTKAKRWIDLDTKLHDRTAIIDAVIKQLFMDLDELIDQDLQVIFDYEAHSLADLSVSVDEKSRLEQVILAQLSPHTQALIKLKEHPLSMELYKVARWKEEVDLCRQKHFEKALQAIDVVISNFSRPPTEVAEEPNAMLLAATSEVELLQQACAGLLKAARQLNLNDENGKQNLKPTLVLLQQQAHLLNGNLQLTHELFEALQLAQRDLEQIELLL